MSRMERKEHSTVELEIEVAGEAFHKAVEASYRKNIGRMNIPGFRRGKAPRKIAERVYGSGVFYEDAVDIAIPDAYKAAVEEHGIDPVGRPDMDVVKLDENGFTFTVKQAVRPEIKLGQYKGLYAPKGDASVPDSDIDEELERLRTRNARVEDSGVPLRDGDTAVIDFEGFVDDQAFEGGKAENHSLKIGSGQFIPGFEEQLTGASAGDSLDVNVKFPEQYHTEDLAGKDAVFKVTVKETKQTIKPELDDEFAKDVSEFDTLDELRADIRKRFEEQRERQTEEAYESALIDKLLEGVECDVPDVMIEEQLDSIMQDFSYRLSMQGLEISQYLKYSGQSFEDLQNMHRETAKRHVLCDLAFRAIADAEGLEVSGEDLEAEYGKLAERYKMSVKKVREAISEKSLRNDMLSLKGSEFLRDNAASEPETQESAEPAETAEPESVEPDDGKDKKAAAGKAKAKKAVKKTGEDV